MKIALAALFLSAVFAAEGPYRPSDAIKPAVLVSRQAPNYPAEAQGALVSGRILVQVLINESGKVTESKVLGAKLTSRIGGTPAEDDHGLKAAALAAVDTWQFKPAEKDGKAVASFATVAVDFGII